MTANTKYRVIRRDLDHPREADLGLTYIRADHVYCLEFCFEEEVEVTRWNWLRFRFEKRTKIKSTGWRCVPSMTPGSYSLFNWLRPDTCQYWRYVCQDDMFAYNTILFRYEKDSATFTRFVEDFPDIRTWLNGLKASKQRVQDRLAAERKKVDDELEAEYKPVQLK